MSNALRRVNAIGLADNRSLFGYLDTQGKAKKP